MPFRGKAWAKLLEIYFSHKKHSPKGLCFQNLRIQTLKQSAERYQIDSRRAEYQVGCIYLQFSYLELAHNIVESRDDERMPIIRAEE